MGSGFDPKTRGEATGVTAKQMVDNGPTFTPGRTNIFDTYTVGVAYVDNPSRCEDKTDAPGCFLTPEKRSKLDQLLIAEIGVAQTNYKFAIEELKIDKLIEKDDDLNWVISLMLDLATSHITSVVGKAINKAKNASSESFGLGEEIDLDTKNSAVTDAMKSISDKTVETTAKTGFDLGKKKVDAAAKGAQNAAVRDERTETLSYLDQLKDRCDIGFQAFLRTVLATASDAERVVLLEGMDAQYHTIARYKAALADKILRYKKSGVADIGQKTVDPGEAHVAPVYASKRCVWLRNADGSKVLWTYHVINGNQTNPWEYGHDPDIEVVPDEFVETALARSEEKWGSTPTLDNPAVALMRGMTAHAEVRKPPAAAGPVASRPIPRLDLGKKGT